MTRCPCGGFIPLPSESCPNCGRARARFRRLARALVLLLGGAAMSVTLAACYGAPAEPYECDALDADGDGWSAAWCVPADELDCDDADEDIHPWAHDSTGDGIDADCDGTDGPRAD